MHHLPHLNSATYRMLCRTNLSNLSRLESRTHYIESSDSDRETASR
jgi:hypothetical protein